MHCYARKFRKLKGEISFNTIYHFKLNYFIFVKNRETFMKRLLTILLLGLCLVSCNRHSEHWKTITDMERIIEERPDSVLNVLQAIDTDELVGDEEPAKHALLLSMALDKNFVDKTDFKVLQPAIDYYEDNGSATDKLRTYYYQGRIYQNMGNDPLAMKSFVNAISKGGTSNDLQTLAKVYYAQSKIYYSLYEWDNAMECIQKAATLYKDSGLYHYYTDCLILIINGYTIKEDYDSASSYIEQCKQISEKMSVGSLSQFYSVYLTYLIRCGSEYEINYIINEYINTIPSSHIDWLTLTNAYITIGEYNEALQSISRYKNDNHIDSILKYRALISIVYEKLGRYEESLRAYKDYMIASDSLDYAIIRQDTKFVEERHNLELQTLRERESKTQVLLWAAMFIILLLVIIVFIRYRLKVNRMEKALAEQETEKYRLLYLQIEEERDNLTNLLVQSEEFAPEIKTAVVKRLELLNKFFTAFITNNSDIDRNASKEMEELLANKDTFMTSTKLAFAGSHPKFIKYLEEHNLSEQEIEICCLYAIGLKGKDIKAYTNQSRHYHQSADIRHKLGLTESDTNLSIFLRDMLEK